MKSNPPNRSLILGPTVVSVGLLASLLIFTSILLVSQSLRSKVYRFDSVYVWKKFDSMSLVNEMTFNYSYRENTVRDVRESKLSDTSLGKGKAITPYGPPEIVGSPVATPRSLDHVDADSVSFYANEPVSTESTGTTQLQVIFC